MWRELANIFYQIAKPCRAHWHRLYFFNDVLGLRGSGMKKILSVFLSLALSLGFLSCDQPEIQEKVRIELMHGWGGTLATHQTMLSIYEEFNKQHPNIELVSLPSADSSIAVKKANDMLALGKMPDILSTNGIAYYVQNAVKRRMALNLLPYIEEDKIFAENIHPSVYSTWMKNGALYTLPDAIEAAGFWCRNDMLRKAGLVDSSGEILKAKNWSEFFSICDKLQKWIDKEQMNISVLALDDIQTAEYFFLARVAGDSEAGLELACSSLNGFDHPAIKNALEDVLHLYKYSKDVNTIEDARRMFLEGKSIFYFNGIWESNLFLDAGLSDEISFMNYPSNYGKSLVYMSPSSGYVLHDSGDEKKIKACVQFLKYILSDEVQSRIANETGQAPSNPNVEISGISAQEAVLADALANARLADVQINSITSIWGNAVLDKLIDFLPELKRSSSIAELVEKMDHQK